MNKDLKILALDLRKSGKSYSEIGREIGVSKSTLSCWLGNKEWSEKIKRDIHNKWKEIDTNRLVKINKRRHFLTLIRHNRYREEALKIFPTLSQDPLFLIGLSLYWGEGDKAEKGRVSVINTDVNMLKIMLSFYRKILKIPEEKLRVQVFIYKDINKNKALKYWSSNLKIPVTQFIKTQVLPSRAKITKKKVKYGVCNVYFSNTELNIKIRQWINLLAQNGINSILRE